MPNYNPSSTDTIGLEWLPADPGPSSFSLDSATKAIGMATAGAPGVGNGSGIGVYLSSVNGQSTVGFETYSSPYLDVTGVPQSIDTFTPATDTSKDTSSPFNSNQAWNTETGAAATFTKVQNAADDVNYLRNTNGFENPADGARMLFNGGVNTATGIEAGKRVLSVEVRARMKSTQTGPPQITGALRLGGIAYKSTTVAVPSGVGYVDLSLGTWSYNPSTNAPWRLQDVNNFLSGLGTDLFGFTGWWLFQVADTLRVSQLYLRIRWQPEDRLAYGTLGLVGSGSGGAGWQTIPGKSVPNLLDKQDSNLDTNTGSVGSWVAGANTTLSNGTVTKAGWTRCLTLTATAAGAFSATSGFYPAIAGKVYGVGCYQNAAAGRNPTISVLFYDAAGNLLQTTQCASAAGSGSYIAMPASAFGTAPTGTTQCKVQIGATASAGAQTLNVQGILLGLDQTAKILIYDVSPGGASGVKIDGGIEQAFMGLPQPAMTVLRRVIGPGSVSVPVIPAGSSGVGTGLTAAGWGTYKPVAQDAAGAIYALGALAGDLVPMTHNAVHNVEFSNGPIYSYSQPYATRLAGTVDTGNTVKAELSIGANVTYASARFVVAAQVDPPGSSLLVKLKRTSDNVQFGSTLTVQPTDLAQLVPSGGSLASRTTVQVFSGSIGAAALAAGTQYYLEFSSAAAVGAGWLVYALDDKAYVNDSVSADTVKFGGTTDAWTDPRQGGRSTNRNGLATIQAQPSTPGAFAGAAQAGFNRLTWTATALGASKFSGYEVQRSEDGGTTWVQIADLNTEAQVRFDDYESRRGSAFAASYRMRVRRKDGGLSAFTATVGPFTQALTAGRVRIVTNELASGGPAVEANDYSKASNFTARSWDFVESAVELEFEGRDGAVVFVPLETEGDRFTLPLALYAEGGEDGLLTAPTSAQRGRAAFEALRVLTRQFVSYLCVLDSDGGRWFANVRLENPTREEPGQLHTVDAVVRQATSTPSLPTTSP